MAVKYKKPVGQWESWQPWTGGPVNAKGLTGGPMTPYKPPAITTPTIGFQTPQYKTPNWAALIAGDPDYESAESEMNKANLFDRGSLRDAIRRAVVEAGLPVGQDEDIDAGTIAAAQGNQFSSAADIQNQLRRGTAQSDAELAARGILNSGQFTENRGVLQRGADTARNSLQNALLNTIATGRNQYASTVNDRRLQLEGIRQSIAARLAQNPGIWQAGGGPLGPGMGGDPFAPLGNASARQMWNAINSASVRNAPQNKALIGQGYDAFLSNYGSLFGGAGGGGGGAPAPATPGGGGASITGYEWKNGVQYAVMSDGRRLSASQLGAKF